MTLNHRRRRAVNWALRFGYGVEWYTALEAIAATDPQYALDLAAKRKMLDTRKQVADGWLNVRDALAKEGLADLAAEVRRFVEKMPPVRTAKESVAAALLEAARRLSPEVRSIMLNNPH